MTVDVTLGVGEQETFLFGAKVVPDGRDVDAFASAEARHHHVVEAVGVGEQLAVFNGALSALDALHVAAHVADVPRPRVHVVAMGGGAKSDVGHGLPVVAVVARAEAGTGKVADFVVLESGGFKAVDEQMIHSQRQFFADGTVLRRVRLAQSFEWRAFLVGQ